MLRHAYTIRDSVAGIFHQPFYAHSHGDAERTFTATVKNKENPNNQIAQFPEGFDLYYLGTYNDESGQFAQLDSPQHIIKAVQLLDR